jgi:hypothetical protein
MVVSKIAYNVGSVQYYYAQLPVKDVKFLSAITSYNRECFFRNLFLYLGHAFYHRGHYNWSRS